MMIGSDLDGTWIANAKLGAAAGDRTMCETCGFPTRQHKSAFDRRDVLALGAAFSTLLAMPAAVADDTPPPKPQNILFTR